MNSLSPIKISIFEGKGSGLFNFFFNWETASHPRKWYIPTNHLLIIRHCSAGSLTNAREFRVPGKPVVRIPGCGFVTLGKILNL